MSEPPAPSDIDTYSIGRFPPRDEGKREVPCAPDAPKLHTLPSIDPAADVVEAAERLLARAKSGELSSFAAGLVYKSGEVGHVRSDCPSFPTQIGALARVIYKMNKELDGG